MTFTETLDMLSPQIGIPAAVTAMMAAVCYGKAYVRSPGILVTWMFGTYAVRGD